MTNESRSIDLVIKAKNQSKRTVDEVRKDIEALNKSIDEQVEASKRGEGSVKNLNAAYAGLEKAMASLVQQQNVINQFQAQAAAVDKLQVRLGEVAGKLREHQAAMAATENVTKRQVQAEQTLLKSYDRAETALGKQVTRLAAVRAEGESLGLNMNDLVRSQDSLLSVSRDLVGANNSLSKATDEYAGNVREAQQAAKALADTQAFEKEAANAAKLNKAGEYVRTWTQLLEKQERQQQDLAESDAFNKQAAEAQKQVKAADYTRFWITELEKLDVSQRQLADNTALNEMADRAIAASRGFTTLAGASRKLVQNSKQVSDTIAGILDPARQAQSTLSGVEERIRGIATTAASAKGPIKDYNAQVRALADAQKELSAQAASIDAFTRQTQAVREARAQFVTARAELLQYAATLRTASAPSQDMVARQKALEQALAAASANLAQQRGRAKELQAGLRDAGIATNDLASAQGRLANAAKQNVGALRDLGAAQEKFGNAARASADSVGFFESKGRTTLSFMQRLRGEVLGLVAAYAGLQGALDLAAGSLEAGMTKSTIESQLAISVGNDPKKIAEEYKYVREQADRIGVSFEEAAKGYAKFAAAAKLAGRSSAEIRYVSEAFQEVGVVAGVTADNMGGIFNALEQIYSKGKIQAEELRGQLGDRLFGAFEIAAQALSKEFPNLNKAMENGEVTANQLVRIAEKYRETVADRLPTAMESLRSNQNRLNSAFFDFKVLISESGFATQYGVLVKTLTEFFQSSDGQKFAQQLGDAFEGIVKVLQFMLKHLDEIQLAVEIAFGLKAASLVLGFASAIGTAITRMLALNAAVAAGTVQVALLQKAFYGLAAFFVGWEIGSYLNREFEVVRQAGVALVIGLEKAFTSLKFAADVVWVSISGNARNQFNTALGYIIDFKNDVLKVLADLATSVGADEFAEKIAGAIGGGAEQGRINVQEEVDKLKAQLEKDLKDIDEIGFQMFQDAADKPKVAEAPAPAAPATAFPGVTDAPKDTSKEDAKRQKAYEKLVKQRIALAEQLKNTLYGIESQISKNEKLSLQDRLAAIDQQYQKLYNDLDKLAKLPGGKAQADAMRSTLDSYIAQLKVQETLKFNQQEQARNEKAITDQVQLRQQLLATIDAQRKAGLLTDLEAKKAIAQVDAESVPAIQLAVDAAIDFAQAHKEVFDNQVSMDTYIAKLKAIRAGTIEIKNQLLSTAQANELLAGGITNGFDSFAKSVAEGENAIDAFRTAFLQFASDFLRQIALMILKQIVLNALQNSSVGGTLAGFVNGAVGQNHNGGTIGSGSNGVTRMANPSWFIGAPKYHTGGIAGLAPDEYPAILQRNEEVLTQDDPRNVLNGGTAGAGQQPATPQDIKVINMVDSVSVLEAALDTPAGTRAIMNVIQANRRTIKTLAGT